MIVECFAWLVALELLSWAILLVLREPFSRWPDRGVGLSKAAGLLAAAALWWSASWWRLLPFSSSTGWACALAILIAGAICCARRGIRANPSTLRRMLASELLFLAVFGFFLALRGLTPEIAGTEKFMDFGLLNSLLRSLELPPPDPWMAGLPVNYYHFGHASWAMLARLLGTPLPLAYNLALATIPAQVAAAAFSLGSALSGRLWLGLVGVFATVFAGSPAGLLPVLGSGGTSYDLWAPSRVIDGTINEFPFFTFTVGDLHSHLMAMPGFMVAIGLLIVLATGPRTWRNSIAAFLALGVALGAALATSSWDALSLSIVGLTVLSCTWRTRPPLLTLTGTLLMAAAAALVAGPFMLSLKGIALDWGWVGQGSPVGAFMWVMGAWLVLLGLAAASCLPRNPSPGRAARILLPMVVALVLGLVTHSPVSSLLALLLVGLTCLVRGEKPGLGWLLAICALAIMLFAETVYLDGSYGEGRLRLNTVFKLHLHAWLLLGVAAPVLVAKILSARGRARPLARVLLALVGLAALAYPAATVLCRAAWATGGWRLDGLAYLEESCPGDFAAIRWLNENVSGQPPIAEAVGEAYTRHGRISACTGLPAVMGWANHERLWRRSPEARTEIDRRVRDLAAIYGDDLARARRVLRRYGIRYLILGELERAAYPAAERADFSSIGRLVFSEGGTQVYLVAEDAGGPAP